MKHFLSLVAICVWLSAPAAGSDVVRGNAGGVVVLAQTEPKTLNPLVAADVPSRDVISVLSADLVHINRSTMKTELALARACTISPDLRHYTIALRDGLRFSDGAPLTADDVVFSFAVYQDVRMNAPQRDLLIVDGTPIGVTKLSATRVRFDLPAPYAPGDRLFDSFWILPKHKLERAFADGRLAQAWTLGSAPAEFAGAGPFRVSRYTAGQRLVLERNPNYWKRDEAGQTLPYLDRLEIAFVPDQNAQMLRLMAHDVSAVGRVRPDDFARLERETSLRTLDSGAGLEYNFLFFNWSAPSPRGDWFRSVTFRQALATALDRDAIVRLVYQGRGSALASQVTPGNRLWQSDGVATYARDLARAQRLLAEAGFRRDGSGPLVDRDGRAVEFSLMVSATNQTRRKMATLIQEDLAALGVRVHLQPTEFGVMTDAVLNTRKFDAAVWGVASGDADPNSDMNVWTTGGTLHVWNLKTAASAAAPPEPWQVEVDRLMAAQMTASSYPARKAAYDRVQQLITANVPVIFLATPHVLAAADRSLGNFAPAVLDPIVLWNADRLFWQRPQP